MKQTLYVLYDPSQGDGDMLGPYHQVQEAREVAQEKVTLIKAGMERNGEVKIIDSNCNTVEVVWPK